jgi:SAM-dependent methyltransferase
MEAQTASFAATGPMPAKQLTSAELKSCCASLYQHPAVHWLLGGELHPGGEAATRRALELAEVRPGDRLFDVASGTGASALLAARELGCEVVGVEYGEPAVEAARAAAQAEGLDRHVSFVRGDAEALPLADGSFDAVLCECSLCTFPAKPRAVREMRRVLRRGGRLALADVVVDDECLPASLRGPLATFACVASALSQAGYEQLLADAGFRVIAHEGRTGDAVEMASRIEDRLRASRLLGFDARQDLPARIDKALELVRAALDAISAGSLGYAIFAAAR